MKRIIELGDLVRLRSGGPTMTVVIIASDITTLLERTGDLALAQRASVTCAWFIGESIQSVQLPMAALQTWDAESEGIK